jgi:hypothetical protein
MSTSRFLPPILIVGTVLLLTGALPRHSRKSTRLALSSPLPAPAPIAAGTVAEPRALEVLEKALAALAPSKVAWLETTIWQRVRLPGCSFQVDGRYLLAPNRRFRLELHTHQGKTEADLLVVRDNDTMWQGWRVGATKWAGVNCVDVRRVLDTLNGSADESLREDSLQGRTFRGVTPLLGDLQARLTWVRLGTARLAGEECLELTGIWRQDAIRKMLPNGRPWPNDLPTLCRLYLDAASLWPRRLEWWGPRNPNSLRLLAEMELRSPQFNQALPKEACAREFQFDPGTTSVTDRTGDYIAEFAAKRP